MNNKSRLLILSMVGFAIFMGLLTSLNYDFLGVREWRGNKAAFSALFICIGLVLSMVGIVTLSWMIPNIFAIKLGGASLAGVLIVVSVFTIVLAFPDKTHIELIKKREHRAYMALSQKLVHKYFYREMEPSISASLGRITRECLAKDNAVSDDLTIVSDLKPDGEITNIDFYPSNDTSSCVSAGISQLHMPTFKCKCSTLPIVLKLKINRSTASITDADINPNEANSRYILKDDTVYDRKTDLTWQRCSIGKKWMSGAGCEGDAETYTFRNAQQLANGPWRLPTKDELLSLIDQNRKDKNLKPAIDVIAFSDWDMRAQSYWASTPNCSVALSNGYVYDGPAQMSFAVLLVRNGQELRN